MKNNQVSRQTMFKCKLSNRIHAIMTDTTLSIDQKKEAIYTASLQIEAEHASYLKGFHANRHLTKARKARGYYEKQAAKNAAHKASKKSAA